MAVDERVRRMKLCHIGKQEPSAWKRKLRLNYQVLFRSNSICVMDGPKIKRKVSRHLPLQRRCCSQSMRGSELLIQLP